MKFKKSLLILAMATAVPGVSFAVGNTSSIEQTGTNNAADVNQINQLVSDAEATITQDGIDLTATINQGRTNYSAKITQLGERNTATSTQTLAPPSMLGTVIIDQQGGEDNTVTVVSSGFPGLTGGPAGNDVTVVQGATSVLNVVDVEIEGAANNVMVDQDFFVNTATVDVLGGSSGNTIDIDQISGDNNTVAVGLMASDSNTVTMGQGGSTAMATVTAVDSSGNTIDTAQDAFNNQLTIALANAQDNQISIQQGTTFFGDNHIAMVSIEGMMNTAEISQEGGDTSTATIDVTGDNNMMSIVQTDCFNCTATETVN